MTAHTATPWRVYPILVSGGTIVYAEGGEHGRIKIAEVTEPANAEFVRRACNAYDDLLAVALAYEAWEADLVLHANWEATADGLPTLTFAQYDRLMQIQAMRNAAVEKAKGFP